MRKSTLYALLGVAGATLVITVIIILGQSGTTKTVTPAPTDSLPPGHVPIGTAASPDAQAQQVAAMIKKLEQASAAKPGDVTLKFDLASAYMMASQVDKAAAIYEGILKDDPANAEAKVQLALTWQAKGDTEKALAALQDLVKADDGNQSAHYALGMVYYSAKDSDKAKAEWEATVKIDPKSPNGKYAQTFLDMMKNSSSSPGAYH